MTEVGGSGAGIETGTVDVLIVGAGINGCAAARQLTADGYSVLLVDREDFGSGATSRSGRTLHCGLQLLAPPHSILDYLRHPADLLMRLKAARQQARDYNELVATLGSCLRPMEIAVPIFRDAAFSGWHVDIGARLIRFMGGRASAFGYRRQNPRESGSPFIPHLANRDRVASVVSFVDRRFHWPERMAIDAALEAEHAGATIRNFTSVERLQRTDGGTWRAELTDTLDGHRTVVHARIVLNLAGVMVDDVISHVAAGRDIAAKIVPVKGVYVLVRLPDAFRGKGFAGANRLGEPFTCLPWDDLHYIGPTETRYSGDLDAVLPDETDVDFLIREFNSLFANVPLCRDDVIMAWAGLRAITAAPGYDRGQRLPFNVLHDLEKDGLPGMLTLSWGIIANHRTTSRKIAAAVAGKISPSGVPGRPPEPPRQALCADGECPQGAALRKRVAHCVNTEHARDLTGVLQSRIGLVWSGRLNREAVETTASTMAALLGWSAEETERQIEHFLARLQDKYRYQVSDTTA